MAVYKLNSKKKGKGDVKKIVGFTLIGVSSVVYLFLTGIWPAMFSFLLGVFGVFAYPLFLVLFIVSGRFTLHEVRQRIPMKIIPQNWIYFFIFIIFSLQSNDKPH